MAISEFHYENINSRSDLIASLRDALITNLNWVESASTTSKTTEMLIKSPDEISTGKNLIAHLHTYAGTGDSFALHIYRPDDDAFTGSNSFDNPDADPPSCFGHSVRDLSDNSGSDSNRQYWKTIDEMYPAYLDVYGDTKGFMLVFRPMQSDSDKTWGIAYAWGYSPLIESQDYPVAYFCARATDLFGGTNSYGFYLSHRNGDSTVKNNNNYRRIAFKIYSYFLEGGGDTSSISGVNITKWVYPFVCYRTTASLREIVTYPNLKVGTYDLNFGDIIDVNGTQYKVVWRRSNISSDGSLLIKIN